MKVLTLILMAGIVMSVLAVSAGASITTVEEVAELDLGDITVVKAINFTGPDDTTVRTIGGVTFTNSYRGITVDGVTNNADGECGPGGGQGARTGPKTDDADLNALYSTYHYYFGNGIVDVTLPNGKYKVQLLLHDGWNQPGRVASFTIEGESFEHDYMAAQGALPGKVEEINGGVLAHTVELTDDTLNIGIGHVAGGAKPFNGLVISQAD